MPVQPRYNAKLDIGTPVLKGYWTNFLNTRADINAAIMEESVSSPAERDRAIRSLYDKLADLSKEEGEAAGRITTSERYSRKMDNDLAMQIIKSAASIDVASTNAVARLEGIKLESASDVTGLLIGIADEKRKSFGDGKNVGRLVQANTESEVRATLNQQAGGDRVKQLGILDQLEQQGPVTPEVQAFIDQQTPGRKPGERIEDYAARTQYIYTADQADEFGREVADGYKAGADGVRSVKRILGAMGIDMADADALLSGAGFSTGSSASAGGQRGGSPERGKADLADTLANNRAMQAQILARIKKLEEQQLAPSSKFGGFYKNAVTETLLRTPKENDRERIEGAKLFSPEEATEINAALKESGGDIDGALEILRGRMKKPEPKAADVAKEAAAAVEPEPDETPAEKAPEMKVEVGSSKKEAPSLWEDEDKSFLATNMSTEKKPTVYAWEEEFVGAPKPSDEGWSLQRQQEETLKRGFSELQVLKEQAKVAPAHLKDAYEAEISDLAKTLRATQASVDAFRRP